MPRKSLTRPERLAILKSLSLPKKRKFISTCCKDCQAGGGITFSQVYAIAKKILGNKAVQQIGKQILVSYVAPYIMKKFKDRQAKQSGSGIRLAGDRKPKTRQAPRKTITRTCHCTS